MLFRSTLRRAMLGDCWEYDIRSAVITWKLTFAEELAQQLNPLKTYESQFWASHLYVTGRREFMRDVCNETFGKNSGLTKDFQDSLIKQAITAIGFGAKASGNGWRLQDGSWANPSIVSILTNHDERGKFLSCPIIEKFISEQLQIDKYLESEMKHELPEIYYGPLITANVNPSRSKAVAYLYQHQETRAMNVAREVLQKYGIKPIADIHDAFVVKKKLSNYVRDEINFRMQTEMKNQYLLLKFTNLNGFKYQN